MGKMLRRPPSNTESRIVRIDKRLTSSRCCTVALNIVPLTCILYGIGCQIQMEARTTLTGGVWLALALCHFNASYRTSFDFLHHHIVCSGSAAPYSYPDNNSAQRSRSVRTTAHSICSLMSLIG